MSAPGPVERAATLHVRRDPGDGSSPAVVFVHGGMDRSSSFGRMARRLGDVPLVRYDRRGYGRSVAAGAGTIEEHVEDLCAVIGGDEVVVFGHSIGGLLAVLAAERRPDVVRGVIAYEAPTPWEPWWPARRAEPGLDPADEAERFMRHMVGDRVWERLPPRTRRDRRAEGPALVADLEGLAGLARPDLGSVVVPVRAVAGSATSEHHRHAAEALAASVRDGELVVVEGASHGIHLTHPAPAAELVRRFLEQVS